MDFKLLFAFSGFLILSVLSLVPSSAGNIIGDIGKAVKNVECPFKYAEEYKTCANLVWPFFTMQAEVFEANEDKADCCHRLAVAECSAIISFAMCGEKTGQVTGSIVNGVNQMATGGRCAQFTSMTQCTNPLALLVIIVLTGLGLAILLQCVCTVLCCRCFKRSHSTRRRRDGWLP